MTVILHTNTALYTASLVQPREILRAGLSPFKEEGTAALRKWAGGRWPQQEKWDHCSGQRIPASLRVPPEGWAQPLGRCRNTVTALQAPRLSPHSHMPPQPKGTFGTGILPKQPPLPQGAPRMPWLPEKLIKPSAAINSAEERAR